MNGGSLECGVDRELKMRNVTQEEKQEIAFINRQGKVMYLSYVCNLRTDER
jgi:hypothetical protein